jgi:diguanylate cyclase (GGDEF)-like protein
MSNHKFAVDPITGFLNRGGSLSLARRVIGAVNAKDQPLALLWLDLDRFHKVNASFGHRGGDRIIAHVATLIRGLVPVTAHCMRMGSDEFVILLPGTSLGEARASGSSSPRPSNSRSNWTG